MTNLGIVIAVNEYAPSNLELHGTNQTEANICRGKQDDDFDRITIPCVRFGDGALNSESSVSNG
jgi:hypothetical protein